MSLRRVIYWVAARALRWFYREHRILGRENIPPTGPVLLVGNHPNDLPDVLAGFFVSSRHPRFIATVSVTSSRPARATYDALDVIPVARVRDARKMRAEGVDLAAVNLSAQERVQAAWRAGEMVAVFPEGGVHDVPQIGHLRTGVAKMVLEYLDADVNNDVAVVPFGNQYEAPRQWGSDMLTVLGPSWSARQWLSEQPEHTRSPAALTAALRRSLLAVTRNSASWEEAQGRDQLIAVAAALETPRDALGAAPTWVRAAQLLAAGAHDDSPVLDTVRVRTAAESLANAVERAGGTGTSATDMARLLYALDMHKGGAPVPAMVLWMGVLAAAIGGLLHAPVLALVAWLARRGVVDRTDFVARCFVPGLYVVAIWWLVVAAVTAMLLPTIGWSPWWALPLLLSLPRFGDLALAWKGWFVGWRLVHRVHQWSTPERMALRAAAQEVRDWCDSVGASSVSPRYSVA